MSHDTELHPDLSARIKTVHEDRYVMVDKHDDGVWLSMSVPGGGAYSPLTKEQGEQLLAALAKILEAL